MLRACCLALLTAGVAMAPIAGAGDRLDPAPSANLAPVLTMPASALLPESVRVYRWQLDTPIQALPIADTSRRPVAEFEFRDDNAFVRVARLRSVSLFTLAEYGKTRLYVGVNGDGVVGLHFSANPRYRDERYLEFIRMPYLTKTEPQQAGALK